MTIRPPARLTTFGIVAGSAFATLALTAGLAGAHVTIGDEEQVAGAYTVLTVSVPHGCEHAQDLPRLTTPKHLEPVAFRLVQELEPAFGRRRAHAGRGARPGGDGARDRRS